MKKLIVLIFVTLALTATGQTAFYANSDSISFENGVVIKVNGTFTNNRKIINEGTVFTQNFTNNGTLSSKGQLITQNFTNNGIVINEGTVIAQNFVNNLLKTFYNDSLIIGNTFTNNSNNFTAVGSLSNTVILKGDAPTKQTISKHSSKSINNLVIQGTSKKYLKTSVRVLKQFVLENGTLAVLNLISDSLYIDSTASITGGSPNSFVIGRLYREKNPTNDSLFFPIGDTTYATSVISNRYRPITLRGISSIPTTKKYPFYFARTLDSIAPISFDKGIRKMNSNRRWHVKTSDPSISVANIKFGYSGIEDFGAVTSADTLVVAQADNYFGKFESIGNSKFGNNFVVSEFKPSKDFFSLGSAYNNKLEAKVFLEGPLVSSTAMSGFNILVLKNIYEFSGTKQLSMLQGYTVPSNAIDVITIYLYASNKIDSVNAWLLNDGTVKDFATGINNFVSFPNSASGSYNVLIAHRNHLPIQFVNPVTISNTLVSLDFTKLSNIYGGGAITKFGQAAMYAGDAFPVKNQAEINALDLYLVSKLSKNPTYNLGNGYHKADLNLDGKVDAADYDLVADHNNKLYYSTIKP